ncbi:MAG: hypothetical protein HZB51_30480 [Chloroflexi bacterium]|nr:hypothetical protein [Chloroflexota bacterium]
MNAPSSTADETGSKTSGERSLWFILAAFGGLTLCICCFVGLMYTAVFGSMIYSVARAPTTTRTPQATRTVRIAQATTTRRATQTPQPTRSTTTATPRATQTAPSARNQWNIVLSDQFNDNRNIWRVGSNDTEYSRSKIEIVNGKYRWDIQAHKGFTWGAITPMVNQLTDFALSVDARQTDGNENAAYGIQFREDRYGNYYRFVITDDGYYCLTLWYEDKWKTLIEWTRSRALRPNLQNRLTVIAEGSKIQLFINDQFVTEKSDSTLKSGQVGVAIEMLGAGDTAVFEFDNFQVRSPTPIASPTERRATSTAVANATSTSIAQKATVTAQQSQALLKTSQTWNKKLDDSFASNSNQWLVGDFAANSLSGTRDIADGKYRWAFKSESNGIAYSIAANSPSISDGALSVDSKAISGAKDISAGLIFRAVDQDNFYVFRITNDKYYVFQFQSKGKLETIGSWFKASAVKSNETNRLTVITQGAHFTFFVNGEYVGQVDDSRYATGKVGVIVGTTGASADNVIEFSNLEIRTP